MVAFSFAPQYQMSNLIVYPELGRKTRLLEVGVLKKCCCAGNSSLGGGQLNKGLLSSSCRNMGLACRKTPLRSFRTGCFIGRASRPQPPPTQKSSPDCGATHIPSRDERCAGEGWLA